MILTRTIPILQIKGVHCTMYNRRDQYLQVAYQKFLFAQNSIKKDIEIYILFT